MGEGGRELSRHHLIHPSNAKCIPTTPRTMFVNDIYIPKRKYIMRDAMCSVKPSTKSIARLAYTNNIVHIWTRIRPDNS